MADSWWPTRYTDQSAGTSGTKRSYSRAAVLFAGLAYAALAQPLFGAEGSHPENIRVTDESFSYQIARDGGRREYRFSEMIYVEAQGHSVCYAREKDKLQPQIDKSLSLDNARTSILTALGNAFDMGNQKEGSCLPLFLKGKESAIHFVSALNRLIWENSPEAKAQRLQQFEQQAAAWRAAGSKVEVPEEAQRHFVIAQQAFQEKNFQHQAEELSAAVQIYPTWPAEQFDLALVLGELNRYSEAVQHMQMYLALAPDAPDAQRAKQQIWIWQDKLQSAQPAPPTQTPILKSKKR